MSLLGPRFKEYHACGKYVEEFLQLVFIVIEPALLVDWMQCAPDFYHSNKILPIDFFS